MLIKGEKFACEACVRGHRVSNCQHADRPLQHINKKGRPVSQCAHCRTLRKSRSAHVRCDCGEKAHNKGTCTHGADPQEDCCCGHGGRCSCALKKEHLDPVAESESDESSSLLGARPRAVTSASENGLTIFTNGHHKPTHKHNNMAHTCGLPYVVPRAHSIHGSSPSGLASKSVDNLLHTSTIDALHSESHIKDSMVSAQQAQRLVKSEHGSPIANSTSNLDQLNDLLPPLDLSSLPDDYNFFQNMDDGFSGLHDGDQPLFSAGLASAASIDWSHYDGLDFNNDGFAASSYSQAASFTGGFDFSGAELQPALTTTSTSGEISEVEDCPSVNKDKSSNRPSLLIAQYGSEISDFGEMDGYRLSAASSFIGLPQAQMLASTSMGSIDVESYLKSDNSTNDFSNHSLPIVNYDDNDNSFALLSAEDSGTFWYNDFPPTIAVNSLHSEPQEEQLWVQ